MFLERNISEEFSIMRILLRLIIASKRAEASKEIKWLRIEGSEFHIAIGDEKPTVKVLYQNSKGFIAISKLLSMR